MATDPQTAIAALAEEIDHHPRGRVPADLRRRHALAVATELFVERGYDGVSMDDVAAAAGVSKPVVYELVGSKSELFGRIMTAAADDLYTRVSDAIATPSDGAGAATPDAGGALWRGAVAFFTWVDQQQETWGALLAGDAPRSVEAVAEIRVRQTDLVTALLVDSARSSGTTVDPERVSATARAVNGAHEALAHWWRDHPGHTPEDMATVLHDLVMPGLVRLVGPT